MRPGWLWRHAERTSSSPSRRGVNGAIRPIACGTGMIPDIRTGQLLTLDHQHMVHVLILAEGYTLSDLSQFHVGSTNDVADWMDSMRDASTSTTPSGRRSVSGSCLPFRTRASFREARSRIRRSAFRWTPRGEVDFSDAVATAAVADRVWREVARLPFPSHEFLSDDRLTHARHGEERRRGRHALRNRPRKSGYGGTTALLTNPGNASQTVASAFAHNRPHEFTHARLDSATST